MKTLFLVPAALAMQVTEDHGAAMNMKGDIEGMKELFLSVSKSKIDDATRQAVAAMMTQITGTLTTAVQEDMQFQMDSLDCKYQEMLDCADTRAATKSSTGVDSLRNETRESQSGHRSCRVTEQTACDATNNNKDLCDAQAAAITKCRRRVDHWDADSGTVKVWMRCIHDQIAAARELIGTMGAYENSCKHQCATRESCNAQQTEFELDFCRWATKVDEMCYAYDECYQNTLTNYNYHIDLSQTAWQTATTQMEALTCLKCYGQSILDNRTDLSHCDGIPCENCPPNPCDEHCPDPPAAVPCDERTRPTSHGDRELIPRPCEQSFLDEEYNSHGMSEDTCTPAIGCVTCHDYHEWPMYFAGRGECLCPEGKLGDSSVPEFGLQTSAHACTEACNAEGTCRYVSYNADTHECIGSRMFESTSEERPTAWSCYSKSFGDSVGSH